MIDRNKEFVFRERDRMKFMAKLNVVNSRIIDEEIAGELQKHLEMLQNKSKDHCIGIGEIIREEGLCCFIRGIAGVGKTSLVKYINLKWARGEMYNDLFDFVFLIKCRELGQVGKATLEEYFEREFGINPESIRNQGNRVLIIIDGIDEVADLEYSLKNNTSLRRLLKKDCAFLPGHSTIITGRPHVESSLKKHQHCVTGEIRVIEITGLTREAVTSYIEVFANGNMEIQSRIKRVIGSSPNIAILSRIPQYLNSLCCILAIEKEGIEIGKMTPLYVWIFVSFIRQHMLYFDKEPFEIFEEEKISKFIRTISEIAFALLLDNKIIFAKGDFKVFDDIIENDNEAKKMLEVFVIRKKTMFGSSYHFKHLSLHEFFAAVYCYQTNICVLELMRRKLFTVVQFVCGFFGPFVNTGIGILASALELALALELASILHMYNEACKTDPGGYVTALYAIYLHSTANCICSK